MLAYTFGNSNSLTFFAVSLGITHSLINHTPSIFIGVPDENSPLVTLPGKMLVSKGKGSLAFYHTYYGSLLGVLITSFTVPLLNFFYKNVLQFLENFTKPIILLILLYIIFTSNNKKHGVITAFLGGLIGIVSFNASSINSSATFLPMFTGLFGTPMLVKKFGSKSPKQEKIKPEKQEIKFLGGFKGYLAGIFSSILPGVGPSSTASVIKTENRKEFLTALGAVNTTNVMTSILIVKLTKTSRTGLADFILSNRSPESLSVLTVIVCGLISVSVTLIVSEKMLNLFISVVSKIPEKKLKGTVFVFLITLITYTTSYPGVSIYFLSTGIGLIVSELDSRKSLLMSCIIIPVLLI